MSSAASRLTTAGLDTFFRTMLDIEGFRESDASLNGIQVDNDGSDIGKIVFAVDANLETIKRAAAAGESFHGKIPVLLFVHHGLFWGEPLALRGAHRGRIKFLLDHNIALYACHLPLDAHPTLGNCAALAELLGMESPAPFGLYHGKYVGWKGKLRKPLTVDEAAQAISFMGRPPLGVWPFGKEKSETCAVISGGAARETAEAIAEGVDLYITGEMNHAAYQSALEARLNVVAGGHYSTEVWGVRRVMETCARELTIETEFVDVPTGL